MPIFYATNAIQQKRPLPRLAEVQYRALAQGTNVYKCSHEQREFVSRGPKSRAASAAQRRSDWPPQCP